MEIILSITKVVLILTQAAFDMAIVCIIALKHKKGE